MRLLIGVTVEKGGEMIDRIWEFFIALSLGILLGMILGGTLVGWFGKFSFTKAQSRGYAHYNSETGEREWTEKGA